MAKAIHWLNNGMVMVFGCDGEQIPDLQGRYTEMRDKVIAAADGSTRFQHGMWRESLDDVPKEAW